MKPLSQQSTAEVRALLDHPESAMREVARNELLKRREDREWQHGGFKTTIDGRKVLVGLEHYAGEYLK